MKYRSPLVTRSRTGGFEPVDTERPGWLIAVAVVVGWILLLALASTQTGGSK